MNPTLDHSQIPSYISWSLLRFKIKFIFWCSVWVCFRLDLRDLWIVFTDCLLTTPVLLIPVGDFHRLQVCCEVGEGGRLEDDIMQQHSAPSQLKPKQIFWGRNNLRVAHLIWGYKDVWHACRFRSSCCCLPLDQVHPCCWDETWWRWCKWSPLSCMYLFCTTLDRIFAKIPLFSHLKSSKLKSVSRNKYWQQAPTKALLGKGIREG